MDYSFLQRWLDDQRRKNLYRSLNVAGEGLTDFQSNDYLGLARNVELQALVLDDLNNFKSRPLFGSTGSRHISGHFELNENLEFFLAAFHKGESGLLFKSGFEANSAVFSSVPMRGDTVLYDSEIHASVKQGIRQSFAKGIAFKHNDLEDILVKANKAEGRVYVAVESVYSMSGDFAPLAKLASLCREKSMYLIVDEAHSTGLFGENGEGYSVEINIEQDVFCRIFTFGKAIGCGGAVVVGPSLLKDYLINRAIPFIYSTSFSPAQLLVIQRHYNYMIENSFLRTQLSQIVQKYTEISESVLDRKPSNPRACIQAIPIGGAKGVFETAKRLNEEGIQVKAIRPPTVPAGKEQLRVVLHSFNNQLEIEHFFDRLKKLL